MNENNFSVAERGFQGPLDITEVRELKPFHDFGAVRVPNRPDLAIRLEIEETTGAVIAISVDIAESNIQLQAFAAPRNEGLWSEIRTSLAQSIAQQGGKTSEHFGSFGQELIAELGIAGTASENPTARHLKFIGVDGPRWFLRIVVTGAALTDPAAAILVEDVIRGVVVNRGEAAMPPRDLLPIIMPAGAAATSRS